MAIYQYAIASGLNVALGSLVNIETIKPTNDIYFFFAPKAYNFYSPGKRIIRGDGSASTIGFASVTWLFDVMTRLQHEYLMTTYASGGYSGNVTIYSRLGTSSYSRKNAKILIPFPDELEGETYAFRRYPLRFTRLETPA